MRLHPAFYRLYGMAGDHDDDVVLDPSLFVEIQIGLRSRRTSRPPPSHDDVQLTVLRRPPPAKRPK